VRDKDLSDEQLSEILNISVNDIIMYEYGLKQIPVEVYAKWEMVVKMENFLTVN
jgi:predicted transcriptional regulator